MENHETLKARYDEYMKLYGRYYDSNAKEFIDNAFKRRTYTTDLNADIVSQVYSNIGAYDDEFNVYKRFYEYLKEHYDLDRKLLEVSSGQFPEMARIISSRQTKGTVTCMDPESIISSLDRLIIKRKKITEYFNAAAYDLIYGLFPCNGIIPSIKAANKNDKDICLALCGCSHFEAQECYKYMGQPESIIRRDWNNYVIETMESTLPESRAYSYELDDRVPYPIIRTYKK